MSNDSTATIRAYLEDPNGLRRGRLPDEEGRTLGEVEARRQGKALTALGSIETELTHLRGVEAAAREWFDAQQAMDAAEAAMRAAPLGRDMEGGQDWFQAEQRFRRAEVGLRKAFGADPEVELADALRSLAP